MSPLPVLPSLLRGSCHPAGAGTLEVSRLKEFHPEPPRRTVRKSLDLHGSHYPTEYLVTLQ